MSQFSISGMTNTVASYAKKVGSKVKKGIEDARDKIKQKKPDVLGNGLAAKSMRALQAREKEMQGMIREIQDRKYS